MNYRHRQCLNTLRSGYEAAVTVGLLHERFLPVDDDLLIAIQFLIPLDGAEVGGG